MPLLIVEPCARRPIEQPVMASLAHLPSGFRPPSPRLAMRRDDEGVPPDLDFNFLLQPSLFDKRLGQPDTTRVANANES